MFSGHRRGDRAKVRESVRSCEKSPANGSHAKRTAPPGESTARPASERLGKRIDAPPSTVHIVCVMRPLACRPRLFALAAFLVFVGAAGAQPASASAVPAAIIRLKHGDDPRWAAPKFDDRDWQSITRPEFPARTGIYWVRVRLARGSADPMAAQCNLNENVKWTTKYSFLWPADAPVDALFVAAAYSYDLFWDGRRLLRNGIVGATRAEEVPGPLDRLVRIPPELLGPGEHVLALRISSYHYNFTSRSMPGLGIALTDFASRLVFETRQPIAPLVCVAGALLMATISEVLYRFADRRRTLRLCSALGLALAVFYGLIALRWLYNPPYDWHAPRLIALTAVLSLIGVLLPWLLLEQFAVPRRKLWLAATLPLLVAAWWSPSVWFEIKVLWICRATLAVSLVIATWAVWRGRPGARLVLVGVVLGLLTVQTMGRVFLSPMFFLIFEGLVLFVFAAVGAQVQADRKRSRELALTAARLETELLKKNIQPHFLLNTLATIIEMIEQTPKHAVALIEALANEFRILARVSGEKLIPLAQELELCRAHLQIMSLRKAVHCTLEVCGVDEHALVPPALFHTLIENGLTHLSPRAGELRFELDARRTAGVTRYTLLARGEKLSRTSDSSGLALAAAESPALPAEGTGTRYMKARLAESFFGHWSLAAGPVPDGWETVIEIGRTEVSPAAATLPFATFALPKGRPA